MCCGVSTPFPLRLGKGSQGSTWLLCTCAPPCPSSSPAPLPHHGESCSLNFWDGTKQPFPEIRPAGVGVISELLVTPPCLYFCNWIKTPFLGFQLRASITSGLLPCKVSCDFGQWSDGTHSGTLLKPVPLTLPLWGLETEGQPQSACEPVKNNHNENRQFVKSQMNCIILSSQ